VGGDLARLEWDGEAVPDGLALKPYPCCYALQRPIAAVAQLDPIEAPRIRAIVVRTPAGSLTPLIHHAPSNGLEGKFSLEYGVAAAVLDGQPGIESFGDDAVTRPQARRLVELVEVEATEGGAGLLAGSVEVEVRLDGGESLQTSLELPPGAPGRPLSDAEVLRKLEMCGAEELRTITWETAAPDLLAPAAGQPPGARAATTPRRATARP